MNEPHKTVRFLTHSLGDVRSASKRYCIRALPQANAAPSKCCWEQESHLKQALLQALLLIAAVAAAAATARTLAATLP